jgi:hypothetical protein
MTPGCIRAPTRVVAEIGERVCTTAVTSVVDLPVDSGVMIAQAQPGAIGPDADSSAAYY